MEEPIVSPHGKKASRSSRSSSSHHHFHHGRRSSSSSKRNKVDVLDDNDPKSSSSSSLATMTTFEMSEQSPGGSERTRSMSRRSQRRSTRLLLEEEEVAEASHTRMGERTRTSGSSRRSQSSRRSIRLEEGEEASESSFLDASSTRSERSDAFGDLFVSPTINTTRSYSKRHSTSGSSRSSRSTRSIGNRRASSSSSKSPKRRSSSSSISPKRRSSSSRSPKRSSKSSSRHRSSSSSKSPHNRRRSSSVRASSSSTNQINRLPASLSISIDEDDTIRSDDENIDIAMTTTNIPEEHNNRVVLLSHNGDIISDPSAAKLLSRMDNENSPNKNKVEELGPTFHMAQSIEAEESVQENKKKRRRIGGGYFDSRCCCAFLALLLLLTGGAVMGVFLVSNKSDPDTADTNLASNAIITLEPSLNPTPTPTNSPTNCPTVLFPPPGEEECEAIAKNQTLPDQDQNMEMKELELFFDVALKDNSEDMQALLPLFMTQIQQYLLPSFAGCPNTNPCTVRERRQQLRKDPCALMNPYVIMNAIANGDYEAELSCQGSLATSEENCHLVTMNLKVFLYGEAKILDLIGSFSSNVEEGGPLVDRLDLGCSGNSPFKIINLVGMKTLDITQSPSASPSTSPSLSPSDVPSSRPSTSTPTASPSSRPTGSPTIAASKSPTMAPSTTPSDAPSPPPTKLPTVAPTKTPTKLPTTPTPTRAPSIPPSPSPSSSIPSISPSSAPSVFTCLDTLDVTSPCEMTAFDWLSNVDTWEPPLMTVTSDRDYWCKERFGLAVFYCATNGNSWVANNRSPYNYDWLVPGLSVCDWSGVTCDSHSEHIDKIDLQSTGLTGTLPTSFGYLSKLSDFFIEDNTVGGSLPSELGDLTMLTRLWLRNNVFTSNVPSELGELTMLTELRLNFNRFTNTIPSDFGRLSLLQTLTIGINSWSGTLPSEMSSLTSVSFFGCRRTPLTGCIPFQPARKSAGGTNFGGYC